MSEWGNVRESCYEPLIADGDYLTVGKLIETGTVWEKPSPESKTIPVVRPEVKANISSAQYASSNARGGGL